MSIILAMVQLTLCMFLALYEYKNKSISVFFWAVIIVIFSIPHLLGIMFHNTEYSTDIMIKASIFVILFDLLYFTTRIIITKNKKNNNSMVGLDEVDVKQEFNREINKKIFRSIFIINIIVIVIFTAYLILKFDKVSNLSWGEIYLGSLNKEGTKDIILENIKSVNHLLFFAVSGLFVVAYFRNWKKNMLIIIGGIIYYCITTRNRITILPLMVGFILIYIIKNRNIKLKQFISISLIGILCIYIVYGILIFRHAGDTQTFFENYTLKTFNDEVANSILNSDGELGLRNIFYYFILIDNNFPGLGEGATYRRLALILIPTSLSFGLKPSDFAITMSSAYTGNLNNTTYSVHPTFFGDAFANFGRLGIFLGVLWAILVYIIDKKIYKQEYICKILLNTIWGTAFVIIARGSIYNGFYIGILGTILLKIIIWISKKRIIIS